MPRSPIRAPKPTLDLTDHLFVFRQPVPGELASGSDTGSEMPFPEVPETLASETVFGNDQPLEIEVGSGKGLFLTNESGRNPEHNFLGIEIIHKYAKHSAARLAKAGRDNAKMISGNAEPLLSQRVPAESLEAVHVYFPDPWWKKRHRKRRVVNERSVKNFLAALRPGGRFHFWTDVLDYFEATIEMIAEIAPEFGVPIPEEKAASSHDLDYRTHFERRSRQNQIPVYRVRYEKR
ncbi:tRNA (guanine-N(7)-)-methyltransferase [Stieleria neptunia]|uniref:tRNA (guanine-N(7)-)-methyltransferase n=1 Tax=Stieleria neptunia TaxID=2527979 RepID=A0A518HWJ7_9BACT|nr:tRNA (guanosine(46)-N7)-methyltransferase TrmB [Stieleria neptunia]QDV45226.1 tRNA (guanine-N(7)-)-methyltransferase [Stieleria neptunia]